MPGEEVPTAAIFSSSPMAGSARAAFGATLTAAPISPKAGAASKTSARIPIRVSAWAAANPASPPPTITILGVMLAILPAVVRVTPQSVCAKTRQAELPCLRPALRRDLEFVAFHLGQVDALDAD